MTTIHGMKAKTVPTAFILAKGTETIASSTSQPAGSRAITGTGVIIIQIISSTIAEQLIEAASSAPNGPESGLVFEHLSLSGMIVSGLIARCAQSKGTTMSFRIYAIGFVILTIGL